MLDLPVEDDEGGNLSEIDDDAGKTPATALPPAAGPAGAVAAAVPQLAVAGAPSGGAAPLGLPPAAAGPPGAGLTPSAVPMGGWPEAQKAPLPAVVAAGPPPPFALPSVLSAGPGALGARKSLIVEEDDYD